HGQTRAGNERRAPHTQADPRIRPHPPRRRAPSTAKVLPHGGCAPGHSRQPVLTRLEETPLREIAELTGGTYTSARTRTVPLGAICLDAISNQPQREDSDDTLPVYQQRYAWFLFPSLVFLAMFTFLGDGSVKKTR